MAIDPRRGAGRWLVASALWAAVLYVLSATRADPDLWGHVTYGIDIWNSRTLPSIDPYSFTQDVPWVNHEWLSELQMGLAWLAGGTVGLTLLKGALVTLAYWLVWSGLRGTDAGVRVGLMLALVLGSARLTATLRPQIWTFVCLALLCRILTGDRRWRWWIAPLFVVWVNVHGGWIVGFGVFAVWSAVEWWFEPARRGITAAQLVSCLAATLVNPYGWGMWDFIGDTVRLGRNVTEWQPLWTVHPGVWGPWLLAAVLGAWLLNRRDVSGLASGAVLAMLAYASIRVERLAPLFVVSAVVLAAPAVRARWQQPALRTAQLAGRAVLASGLLSVAAVVAAYVVGGGRLTCIPVAGSWVPDARIAGRLDRAVPGRLVVFFDWGQYALWHWGPSLRVSMDGRRETIYSDSRLIEHEAILGGTSAGLRALETWRPEYVWLPERTGLTRAWLDANGYRIELVTGQAFLAVREDLPALPTSSTATTVRRCFPF